jgi:hypothetical protein
MRLYVQEGKRVCFRLTLLGLVFAASPAAAQLTLDFQKSEEPIHRRWAFMVGMGRITSNSVNDIVHGDIDFADGDDAGNLYLVGASCLLGEMRVRAGRWLLRPTLETPFTVEIFDEHSRRPFRSYNASIQLRWRRFPWNRKVATTLAMGVGLSYSERIPRMERKAHKGGHVSQLRFAWPIELTLAHPKWPQHQMVLFVAHRSGGRLFDRKGLNSVGLGYRFSFW